MKFLLKQILQNLVKCDIIQDKVLCPRVKVRHLIILTITSLVTAGIEKMMVDFGRADLIDKVRQQTDKVKMTIDKSKTDSLMPISIP